MDRSNIRDTKIMINIITKLYYKNLYGLAKESMDK